MRLLFILLFVLSMPLSAIEVLSERARLHILNETTIKDFDLVTIEVSRERNGEEMVDSWRGIRFIDIQNRWGLTQSQFIQFLAHDKYLVMLNQQQIAEFDPIIAVERNSSPLDAMRYRLISPSMPAMFWVAGLQRITPIKEIVIPEPVTIYPYHTALSHVRLQENPAPFVNVKGYRLWDIISMFTNTSSVVVRIVSKDGLEQILDFNVYLHDAILAVDDGKFSIQSPSMPSGMWLKDIMLIEVNAMAVIFYRGIDRENNEMYREFVERISRRNRTAHSLAGIMEITNWENFRWENATFVR